LIITLPHSRALGFWQEGWPALSKITGDELDPCPLGLDPATPALDLTRQGTSAITIAPVSEP